MKTYQKERKRRKSPIPGSIRNHDLSAFLLAGRRFNRCAAAAAHNLLFLCYFIITNFVDLPSRLTLCNQLMLLELVISDQNVFIFPHSLSLFLQDAARLFSRVPPCHWNVQVGVFFLMAFIRLKWKERGLEVSNLKPFLTSKGDSEPQKNFFYVDSRMKWNQSEVEKKIRSPSSFFSLFFKWAEIHLIVWGEGAVAEKVKAPMSIVLQNMARHSVNLMP